ncbi:hypothetical protein BpHYR1_018214 [Brachionus plicatilis]|uniref:Uncharacterized protein n=1 Tax=Brachionus plicatilis TaxID=10195 RepID=A0A3M7S2N0_BRAPC|nr:hypothetical protein BpHYR1_018214 [Brachionus plicatilis]
MSKLHFFILAQVFAVHIYIINNLDEVDFCILCLTVFQFENFLGLNVFACGFFYVDTRIFGDK